MISEIARFGLIIAGCIILYEIFRALILSAVRSRLYKSVSAYIDKNRIRVEKFKFMHKIVVKHELLNDHEIHESIIQHAREKEMTIRQSEDRVEEYIDEIVPFFNLLSYYKIGFWIARFVLNLIYEVVIDGENAAKLKKIPEDSVIVFVMNHRSNIDYILVAYMLAQQISLSYAVGEWARVWPLEYIFKSFGAYFIRRKYREKLYHLVLEKYVQLISLQGVTQGIFIEGGLTRDGKFRKPKIGILDYIIKIRKNPEFSRELVFLPASINYDWVLEDNALIQEWKKGLEKSGFLDNAASLARIMVKGPFLLVVNLVRYMTGRLKQHGYASVSFGDPVYLSDFLKKQKKNIFSLDRRGRLEKVQEFADILLDQIGKVMPVTPMTLTAGAILSLEKTKFTMVELLARVARFRELLRGKNGRMVLGRAFETGKQSLMQLDREKTGRKKELVSFEEDFLHSEEAAHIVDYSIDLMRKRKMVSVRGKEITVNMKKMSLMEYYGNSIHHLLHGKKGT